MALTEREKKVIAELSDWELALSEYVPNDLELVYEKNLERSFALLPEEVQEQVFLRLDSWLFHLHSLIQGSQLQAEAKERILAAGRVFQPDLNSIQGMTELSIEQIN